MKKEVPMNRNPKLINETRYTSQNPPDDDETAQAQIRRLQDDVGSIESDLEQRTVHEFHDQPEFEFWQRRAAAAIRYKKKEAHFLESWLKKRVEARQETARIHASQELEKRIEVLTDTYHQRYLPVFGIHHPAEDPEEAKARIFFLLAMQSQIDADLLQLQKSAAEHDIESKELQRIERPLRSVEDSSNTELQYLKNVLRILNPATDAFREQDRAWSEQEILCAQRMEELARDISNERPRPYDADNPPIDAKEAKARLRQLDKIRKKRQSRSTELSDAWRATTGTGLPKWVKRPLAQLLASVDEEAHLVNEYIRQHNREANAQSQEAKRKITEEAPQDGQADRRTLENIGQDIRDQASRLAKEIQEEYVRIYTDEQPLQQVEEAEDRLKVVLEVKARLQSAFCDITDAWCSHPLRRKDMSSVKRPLTKILSEVEAEIAIIKTFLADRGVEKKNEHVYWKAICVSALTRASFEGFKLTTEEQEVIKMLLANISRTHSEG